jgi:hypothetical protein
MSSVSRPVQGQDHDASTEAHGKPFAALNYPQELFQSLYFCQEQQPVSPAEAHIK